MTDLDSFIETYDMGTLAVNLKSRKEFSMYIAASSLDNVEKAAVKHDFALYVLYPNPPLTSLHVKLIPGRNI